MNDGEIKQYKFHLSKEKNGTFKAYTSQKELQVIIVFVLIIFSMIAQSVLISRRSH